MKVKCVPHLTAQRLYITPELKLLYKQMFMELTVGAFPH